MFACLATEALQGMHSIMADAIDRKKHMAGLGDEARELCAPLLQAAVVMQEVGAKPAGNLTQAGHMARHAPDIKDFSPYPIRGFLQLRRLGRKPFCHDRQFGTQELGLMRSLGPLLAFADEFLRQLHQLFLDADAATAFRRQIGRAHV